MKNLYVVTNLNPWNSIDENPDLDFCIARAEQAYKDGISHRVWVLDDAHDIYAYVDSEGTHRF